MIKELSIQLYSLRDETKNDFIGVLKKLGEIGYTGVEFAGYGDIPAEIMKNTLDECGMKSVGSHVGLQQLKDNLEFELEYNKALGTKYIVVPHCELKTKDDCLRIADEINGYAEIFNKNGFLFAYHNHDFEFKKDGDRFLLDILFENLHNVYMELDMYWATYAGVDALSYLSEHKNAKLLHLKQIKDLESKQCVDLNEGMLDFKEIISKALSYGVEEFILEQETFAISPYVSVKNGYDHIMKI